MNLSHRLRSVSDLVLPCRTAADIGTDHAYVPVDLIMRKTAQRAIAMDINRGPLERAGETIRLAGLSDVIETRLSDGMKELSPGEADAAVIAGMGGALTVRILTGSAKVTASLSQLVLQPQSEIFKVRRCIGRLGFMITDEDMVLEDGKYYPMMRAEKADAEIVPEMKTEEEWYGPVLLAKRHPVLWSYLEHERSVKEMILKSLLRSENDAAVSRRLEVEADLERNSKALAYF